MKKEGLTVSMSDNKTPMMSLEAAIGARRSIRRYETVPVERAKIEHMLDMAKMSPSPKNRQAWRVRILEGAAKDQFVEMGYTCLQALKETDQKFGSLEISLHAMKTAGAVLIVYNPFDDDIDYDRIWKKSDLQALGAFINTILLMATQDGLGSLWINDIYFIQEEAKAWLNISHEIAAVLTIGVPAEHPFARPRLSLRDIIDEGEFIVL